MKRDLLDIVRCPECAAFPLQRSSFVDDPDGSVVTGVLSCTRCSSWYPIEDRVLELLQRSLAYGDDRQRFWQTHKRALEGLGLKPHDSEPALDDVTAQRSQQEHFDWYSDNETQSYAIYEAMRSWKIMDQRIFASWRKMMRPGGRLLDVGCAQGRSSFKVQAPDVTIVGFDVSKHLVAQAVKRARVRANMHFFVGDATRMPIVDGSFDHVLVYGVLHHLPQPPRVCREAARVLKPGGVLFCSENNETVFYPVFELLQRVWPIWYEEAGEHAHIHSDELKEWLEDAGFRPQIRSEVFVPPHLLNVLPLRLGRDLLNLTDRTLASVPWLRDQGGLLVSTSVKAGS